MSAFDVTVRSHSDTSGIGGLDVGMHVVDRADLPDLEAFILDGQITFHLPIKDLAALNQQLNEQILRSYLSDLNLDAGMSDMFSSGGVAVVDDDGAFVVDED